MIILALKFVKRIKLDPLKAKLSKAISPCNATIFLKESPSKGE